MPVFTVNLGGYHRTSTNGAHQWGEAKTFSIPSYVTPIKGATITFDTEIDSGTFAYKRFYINQVIANSGESSGSKMSTAQLRAGQSNGFSTGIASAPGHSAQWKISNIKLNISYGGDPGTMTLNKTSMDAGQTVRVSLGKADAGVKRTVKAYFGSESTAMATLGTNLDDKAQYVDWEYPIERCDKMPSATSGTVKIKMTGSEGGEVVKSLTVKVPAEVGPGCIFEVELNRNGVPEDIDGYVLHRSKCDYVITADTGSSYGAGIADQRVTVRGTTVKGATGSVGPFTAPGEAVLTATVTDARGRKVTAAQTIVVQDYNTPGFEEADAWRCNAAGSKDRSGTYIRLYGKETHSALEGDNPAALDFRVWQKGGAEPESWTALTDGEPLIYGGGTVTADKTYLVKMRVSDLLESRTMEFVIPTKKSVFSVFPGLGGAAIGKTVEIMDALEIPWSNIFLRDGARVITDRTMSLPKNILHNWDFRRRINQRGASGTISSGGYFFDRWIRQDGTLGVGGDYLTMVSGAVIEQRIEGHELAGETVTLSVRVGNDVYFCVGIFPAAAGTETLLIEGFGAALLGYHANYMYIRLATTGTVDIRCVKLEMGTQSTLRLDAPADYTMEELKCCRFLYMPNIAGFTGYQQGTAVYIPIPTRARMRSVPELASGGGLIIYDGSGSYYTTSGETLAMTSGSLRIEANNATSLSRKVIVVNSGNIEANAEL